MSTLQGIANKHVEKYTCLFSDSNISGRVKRKPQKANLSSRKRNKKQLLKRLDANKKNLSDKRITNDEINLLAKGLKFIPTPVTKEIRIKRQLLRDFEQFARRMRLRYIYHKDRNRGLAWPLPKMPPNLLTAEELVAVHGQSNTEELPNHSMA